MALRKCSFTKNLNQNLKILVKVNDRINLAKETFKLAENFFKITCFNS